MPSNDSTTPITSPRALADQPLADVAGDWHTIDGEKWFTCDRSGFNFPVSRMIRQNGLRVADIYADEPGRMLEGTDPRNAQAEDIENPYGF